MSTSDYGFMTHERKSSREPAKILSDLDFADDISLLESSKTKAEKQLQELSDNAIKVGLKINLTKTVLYESIKSESSIKLNGKEI